MMASVVLCRRCGVRDLKCVQAVSGRAGRGTRRAAYATDRGQTKEVTDDVAEGSSGPPRGAGAMSRRLQEATEEALLEGGRDGGGRRIVLEEAGFSEELKARLLKRVADMQLQADHGRTLATEGLDSGPRQSSIPRGAAGTRHHAGALPWTGDEPVEDTVLRMLDDAHKPLAPGLRGRSPAVVADLRPKRRAPPQSAAQRLSSARERVTAYEGERTLSETERAAYRQELHERFAPGARPMPSTVSGLTALANERIEDAMARGQFRAIARGPGVGATQDHRANSPFIDTTSFLMNRMLQRQELVPPWIEKQQELAREARAFRTRLRRDWQRHATHLLASGSGPLQSQLAAAERYAAAERRHNASEAASAKANSDTGLPLRDPTWEKTENAYQTLAVARLNALTRSYNLMAPELAKKPYISLDRELRACYADIAPTLAATLRGRAAYPPAPHVADQAIGAGLFSRLSSHSTIVTTRVHDSKTPHYGMREMWRDLWKRR